MLYDILCITSLKVFDDCIGYLPSRMCSSAVDIGLSYDNKEVPPAVIY